MRISILILFFFRYHPLLADRAADEMPKRSAKGSSTTARVAKRGSAQRVAHSSNQSAANLFINTLEIRRHFFDLLDTPTLAAFTRVEKGLTYDVARVLYKTVDYVRLRDTMARANVSF